jgi:cell division protein FtsI/penicillin-binding protein 2
MHRSGTYGGRRRRTRLIVIGSLGAAIAAVASIAILLLGGRADGPDERLRAFLDAWERGDDRAAAALTDQPGAALDQLRASRRGLDGARLTTAAGNVDEGDGSATARATLAWEVPAIGRWRYDVRIDLAKRGDGWTVRWSPAVIHPRLDRTTRLGTAVIAARRGAIVDRHGGALMTDRPVTDVAVQTAKAHDSADTAARIAALVDVDAQRLERAVRRAPKGRFIPVITLRRSEYDPIAEQLAAIPGASVNHREAPLAPTKGFARALLGTVGPATAEQVEQSNGRVKAGEEIGQWGLQARFEERLRGSPTRRIVIRDMAGGEALETLLERRGRNGRRLTTTLDRRVQAAAESALGARSGNAALVAVRPSTGDILAVANRPLESSYDRALEGLYPPGSTFKVVSTAALLRDGLGVDDIVTCPATRNVGGRSFRNFEGGAAGAVPFRIDFAESCNTAFVGLSRRLDPGVVSRVARDFGLGREIDLPLPAATSKVPAATDDVARAAIMIGQDRIVASPLAMAGVAATVADGRWRAPRLLASDRRGSGPRLGSDEAITLRSLMRLVVTSGTGDALASVPGEPAGKSGTAEYGSGDPPPTHAWFIAFRGDVAMAILVEGGRAGGSVAAPIAARFFAALDR